MKSGTSGTARARLSAEPGATAISLFRKKYEKLTRLTIGVSVAELQKALENGMLVCGRNSLKVLRMGTTFFLLPTPKNWPPSLSHLPAPTLRQPSYQIRQPSYQIRERERERRRMYIYICIYLSIYIYIDIYACMHKRISIHIYTYIRIDNFLQERERETERR